MTFILMPYGRLKGISPKHWSNGVAIKVIFKKKVKLQRTISLHGFSSNSYLKLSRGAFILIQKNRLRSITNAYKMNLVLMVFPLTFTHPGQHSVTAVACFPVPRCFQLASSAVRVTRHWWPPLIPTPCLFLTPGTDFETPLPPDLWNDLDISTHHTRLGDRGTPRLFSQ